MDVQVDEFLCAHAIEYTTGSAKGEGLRLECFIR